MKNVYILLYANIARCNHRQKRQKKGLNFSTKEEMFRDRKKSRAKPGNLVRGLFDEGLTPTINHSVLINQGDRVVVVPPPPYVGTFPTRIHPSSPRDRSRLLLSTRKVTVFNFFQRFEPVNYRHPFPINQSVAFKYLRLRVSSIDDCIGEKVTSRYKQHRETKSLKV